MCKYVSGSFGDTGTMDADKMAEFFEAISKRIDLAVGYSMGLDRVLELIHKSIRSEILRSEDSVGGTKANTMMLEGAIGTRSLSLEGCHPTV